MREFILSLSVRYQLLFILLITILVAFIAANITAFLFGSVELISKLDLIVAIYAVLGTIYAVLVAFSISGVWQNYCASETSVITEVAALTDLVHMVKASSTSKAQYIRDIVINYLNEVIEVEWSVLAKGRNDLILSPTSNTFLHSMHIVREIQTIETVNARDNVVFSHVLTLLTKWLDARRTRLMISKGDIAKSLWPLLITGAFILFSFHGLFSVESRLLWSTLLLLFSGIIGLSFYLIFTLDCPFAGYPMVDSAPFTMALNWLKEEKNSGKNPAE